jgi:hypothetical protein
MTNQPHLRVCDDTVDVQDMIREALERVQATYTLLAQTVMLHDQGNSKLPVLIAKAQAANSQMLSTLRHPAGHK